MPAIKLFGRKWLAASDDLVYPGLFEIFIRTVWLILIGIACSRYYQYTSTCQSGGELVRAYLLGVIAFLLTSKCLMLVIVKQSAKGTIMETKARKYVEPLLTVKILLLLPEIAWNILGSLWMFGPYVKCSYEHYTVAVVQTFVLFDWILIGLTIFGLALVFDPLGTLSIKPLESSIEHDKVLNVWIRRFRFFWWMRKDENADETFQHVAGVCCSLFRGTNWVPSDVLAGLILLRIKEKREVHELRRLNLLPVKTYTSNASEIFRDTPPWMSLENAHHYMKLCIAIYGWIFAIYQHSCVGCFNVMKNLTYCGCLRRKSVPIEGDNCCYCYLAGVQSLSPVSTDDIIFASFKDRLCEIPFCVLVDHNTNSIVIVIRGSLSIRDIFTDFAADSGVFEGEGIPPGTQAHISMIIGARVILKLLNDNKILERAFNTYPAYNLVITGHSLGAGISILLAYLLRPRYPFLIVYGFCTPAGLITREAARLAEEFVLTIGIGDDLVMRLSVDSIENLRTAQFMALRMCRLPKYRIVLNGFGYMLFGIPEKDLSETWITCNTIPCPQVTLPLLDERESQERKDSVIYERDFTKRRCSKAKLYIGGRILHITRCESEKSEGKRKKKGKKEKKFRMRWAQAEEFSELVVMPRMFLDHLPETMEETLGILLKQQHDVPYYIDP
ncbi:diacylglycerol lipase-beta [Xylocopa sonorina]|uniref:diacylglycerol lipase-beta n=1 Tax=Xylocopa sonorina TaxID=1818115 RepID=UPI00403B0446